MREDGALAVILAGQVIGMRFDAGGKGSFADVVWECCLVDLEVGGAAVGAEAGVC